MYDSVISRTVACQAPLSTTVSWSLLKFIPIELVMLSVSSSAAHFYFCLQSFPASGSFPMSHLVSSGGQSIGTSASGSVISINIQGWFPVGLTSLFSLQSKRLSRVFSSTTILKHPFFSTQLSLWFNSHIYSWLPEKPQL